VPEKEQEESPLEVEMIRVAVPADENKGLDSLVSPGIEHCPYFVLVDFEEREVKTVRTVPNCHDRQHPPGQGPGLMQRQRVDVVLTGGPEGGAIAFQRRYRIREADGAPATVRHTLEEYVGYRLGFA
jgi:predicted Fe-Mo cluster-binding NifX family protein